MDTNQRITARPPLIRNRYRQARFRVNLDLARFSRAAARPFLEKHAADLLTLARIILAAALIWAGLSDGQADLGRDLWILVLAWSTDMVDGRLSRMLKTHATTWLGRQDVYIDMFVSVAVLIYLAATGLLPVAVWLVYVLVWGAIFLRWGIPALFAQIFQNPIYAYFVILAVITVPQVLPWLLLFALAAFLLFRQRLFELLRSVLQAVGVKR